MNTIPKTQAAEIIIAGLERLRDVEVWRSIVSEALPASGVEGLVQKSLVWALNTSPNSPVLASMEQRLPVDNLAYERSAVDIILHPSNPQLRDEWWSLWETYRSTALPAQIAHQTLALMELKPYDFRRGVIRNAVAASHEATGAATSIIHDVMKLRSMRNGIAKSSGGRHVPILELVLQLGYFPVEARPDRFTCHNIEQVMDAANGHFWTSLTAAIHDISPARVVGECWLLQNEPYPSNPVRRTFLKAILIDID